MDLVIFAVMSAIPIVVGVAHVARGRREDERRADLDRVASWERERRRRDPRIGRLADHLPERMRPAPRRLPAPGRSSRGRTHVHHMRGVEIVDCTCPTACGCPRCDDRPPPTGIPGDGVPRSG